MIGIQRTEIDRSQVLRPVEGESYGIVLQVPYGPLTPTYIDNEGLLMDYFAPGGKPDPDYKDYYEAIILLKQAPLLACRPQGDGEFGGVTVEKAGTGNAIAALSSGIPDLESYTFPSVDTQFIVVGADPSADNDNYSIKITASSTSVANTFDLTLYYDGTEIDTFNVSLVRTQVDDFGNSVYITEILKNRSDVQVVVNTAADLTVLPVTVVSAVSFGAGVTNTSFAPAVTITAWNNFSSFNDYYSHYLVDCSCNETVGKAVIDIAEANWYQHVFLGAPSIKSTNPLTTEELNTWRTTTEDYRDVNGSELNVNTDHASLYGVWGEVNDNYNGTTVWISPVSTAAARRAFTNNNIGFSQAAAGVNANRGISNDFIRLEQDASSIVDELGNNQINVLTYTPQGKAIWNEWNLQVSHSNTSYQSHRILFNTLEENIEALLVGYNFTDNNPSTRAELKSILDNYLQPMITIHLDAAEVRCNASNNPASLANQRKMKVQVGVIPYPKANKLIFEFIHTRTGVSLSEVF